MEIVETNYNLPVTVDKLNNFIIVGKERLNAQKAKIRAIDKTEMAVEAKEAALADAQDMADILLDAEVKLGEILEAIPPQSSQAGRLPTLPPDVSYKASHQAQTLSKNRDIVEQAKARARDAGEIPTASRVYKLIKKGEKKEKREVVTKKITQKITFPKKEEIIDPEFQKAWDQLFIVIKNLKAFRWKPTSRETVRNQLQILIDIVEI